MKRIILLSLAISGCAAMPALVTGLSVASQVVPIVDGFYNTVLEAKKAPSTLQAATLILQQADKIVTQAQDNTNGPSLVAQATLLAQQAKAL